MSDAILFSCGDISGDIYVGEMVRLFRKQHPEVSVFALGGEESQKAGANLLYQTVLLSTFGFWEVLGSISEWKKVWDLSCSFLREYRPRVVVLVDNPGFNFRLARFCQKLGIPVVYFAPPQVWAWGKKRGSILSQRADWIFPLFPWEVPYFSGGRAYVEWVGHPIVELSRRHFSEFQKAERKPWLVLLPGSRKNEIFYYFQVVREYLRRVSFQDSFTLTVIAASKEIREMLKKEVQDFPVVLGMKEELPRFLHHACLAITCAGTVTLEVALAGVPQVIVYRLSRLSFWLAKMVFRGSWIGLPNIVLGELVCPELVQDDFSWQKLQQEVTKIMQDPEAREKSHAWAEAIRKRLDQGNPFERVVAVLERYY